MPNRLWIVPCNDLESVTTVDLLRSHSETVLITEQRWGASWAQLEGNLVQEIRRMRDSDPNLRIYGIELAGPNDFGAVDIDHHSYPDEDRFHPESSLEQVAAILEIRLDDEQQLIAANDREWIPGMENLHASRDKIQEIRRRDREAQGVNRDDELRARAEVDAATQNGLMIIDSNGPPTSAHSDFAYWRGAREMLVRGREQWFYSGRKHRILASLSLPEQHWSGGGFETGYFGIDNPSVPTQDQILKVIEPSGSEGTQIDHMDIVLHWPLRLDAFGDLQSARRDSTKKPQEWLNRYADWICGTSDGHWNRCRASKNVSLDDRQSAYSEFVYFHPFVQELLFPSKANDHTTSQVMLTLERKDVNALHLEALYNDQTHKKKSAVLEVELPVDSVRLHLLLTDIAILTVHMRVPRELALDRALDLLNQVRRVYVPYWGDRLCGQVDPQSGHRSPGQCPLRANWLFSNPSDKGNRRGVVSEYANRLVPIEFSEACCRPDVLPHWREILEPITPLANGNCVAYRNCKGEEESLRFRLLGDERMFLVASVLANDPRRICDAQWMRLAFVDEGGGDWAYSKEFLEDTKVRRHHFYDRFWNLNTRYLVTGYSFVQVMQNNAFTWGVLRPHLLRHYSDLSLLAVIQKASILTMSHRLVEVLQNYHESVDRDSRERFHDALKWLAEDFAAYMALYEFTEVSNQLQAVELFQMLRRHLHIRPLFKELHMQLEFAAQMENGNYTEWVQNSVNFWVPVAIMLAWLGIGMGWSYVDQWISNVNLPILPAILELILVPAALGWLGWWLFKSFAWRLLLPRRPLFPRGKKK